MPLKLPPATSFSVPMKSDNISVCWACLKGLSFLSIIIMYRIGFGLWLANLSSIFSFF